MNEGSYWEYQVAGNCTLFWYHSPNVSEVGAPHHNPHFHAYYQNYVAVYSIDTIDLISGSLPRKQQRLVEAWTELHHGELLENWERLQSGHLPYKIAPLK